jgi:hypothetical protein
MFRKAIANKNCVNEEIQSKLNAWNACYYVVWNLALLVAI